MDEYSRSETMYLSGKDIDMAFDKLMLAISNLSIADQIDYFRREAGKVELADLMGMYDDDSESRLLFVQDKIDKIGGISVDAKQDREKLSGKTISKLRARYAYLMHAQLFGAPTLPTLYHMLRAKLSSLRVNMEEMILEKF